MKKETEKNHHHQYENHSINQVVISCRYESIFSIHITVIITAFLPVKYNLHKITIITRS